MRFWQFFFIAVFLLFGKNIIADTVLGEDTAMLPLPAATLTGGNVTVCEGTCHNLTLTLTGTGPWTVDYTLNGNPQTPLSVSVSPYLWNVCPSATSTYCITSVEDATSTNSPVTGQCAEVTVAPYPVLANYTLTTTDICEGETTTLSVNYSPAGYNACLFFTVMPPDLPDFVPPFCSQPSIATFTSNISPDVTTIYCLDSIYFENAPQCATAISICRTLNVHGGIAVVQTNIECNDIGTQYRVTYALSDGEEPYAEAGTGVFAGTTYTTDWVNNGSASWSFTDIYACNTLVMNVNHTCPVLTDAGTMVNNPLNICGNGQATAAHNSDEFLDGNDELMFILYDDAGDPLNSIVQTNCTAPEFSFDAMLPMTYGTVYYIAAVAGDEGTAGCVNTSANNVQVSNNTSVIWHEVPIVDAGTDLDQCVGLPIIIGTPLVTGQTYSWTSTNYLPPSPSNVAEPIVTINTLPSSNPIEYVVTAYSAQCSATDTMLLTIHGLPSITVTAVSDSLCFASCTDLEVSGSGTLTYEWTPSSSISTTDLTAGVIEVCPAGNETFEVTAYETHGSVTCEITESIDIVIGTEVLVAEYFTEQVCYGTCEGEIHLIALGGFAPYYFDITEDITDWDTFGLCPATYDYTVFDAIGCPFSGSILIEERPEEVINDITITQPICAYDLGTIQVNNAYTSYSIAGCSYTPAPSSATTGLFQNVPPCDTEYTITAAFQVSPTEFCTATTTVLIEPLSPEIMFNPDWTSEVFCYDTQACFDANPTGGSGALDVFWYSCPSLSNCQISTAHPFCVAMQADHTYYGVAIDALGCRSDTVMIEAFISPEILLDVQNGLSTTTICEYDCIDLVAAVSGGNGNVPVDWFQTPNIPIGTSPVNICPVVTTAYYAVAHDGCSQEKTDTLVVVVHDTPEVLIDADIYEGCYPQTISFIDLSGIVEDNHTCVWNFGTGSPQTVCGDISFTYPSYGVFHPTYTITTEFGCVGTHTLAVPVTIYGKPQMGFTWQPQPVTVIDNHVQFNNTTIAAVSYVWTVQGVGTSIMENPEFTFPPDGQSVFEVCLEATTANGCIDTLCKDVFVETVMQVFVPNAFTPDPDSDTKLNDVFLPTISGHDPDRYKIWILNRWGDMVFYSTDPTQSWSGDFDGSEHFVPNGTYLWYIECYEMDSNNLHVYQGTVTIIR